MLPSWLRDMAFLFKRDDFLFKRLIKKIQRNLKQPAHGFIDYSGAIATRETILWRFHSKTERNLATRVYGFHDIRIFSNKMLFQDS